MTSPSALTRYKLRIIILGVCCSFLLLFSKLVYLQIYLGTRFLKKSTKNFLRFETVMSPRGNIVDSYGNLLATNRPKYNVYWKGGGSYRLLPQHKQKLKILEKIIGKPYTDDKAFTQRIERAERYYKKELIASDINFEQLSRLEETFPHAHNISIEQSFKRFYPHGAYASHILGYLGNINFDVTGKMGLEHLFENTLKGKQGTTMTTINSLGRKLTSTPLKQALTGTTIATTINLDLQNIVESVFPQNKTGVCILMDTYSGEILAITSRPHFDPNVFLGPILHDSWKKMQVEQPFLNRTFNASYPPGSIFKLVVTSAAIETGVITPETVWDCKGFITFAGRKYRCHKQQGHGKLTVSQALEQSCNPLFFDIGTKMSINTMADYAHRFGLGEKTNVIFPEKTGLIPTIEWKQEKKGERWWPGETLSAAVGQSFLLVTPIQIVRMIASIFSGYLVSPRILKSEPFTKKPLQIKPETLDFLKRSMKKVVTQGTGKRIGDIKNIEIYAKTSTAQTSALHKRHKGRKYREHGWFVAQFYYKAHTPLTMVVLVEHAGTSRIPVLIAKRFFIRYKTLMDKKFNKGVS